MSGSKKGQLILGILLLLILLFNASVISAAEKPESITSTKQAGKTLLTRGSVISKRASGNVTLKRRSAIFEQDEVHVGNDGRAQFRMIDQALISVQENSILQIKDYKYKKGAKNNSVLLELLSGGLRTITGAVGKDNKKAYELRTPLATIGIRGTDYEVEIVSSGMYVAVWDGIIHLQSRLKNGCNMLIGRSQPYMFIFIDRLGKCKGLLQVPDVFATGHSSNIPPLQKASIGAVQSLKARPLSIQPLSQATPHTATSTPLTSTQPPINDNLKAFTVDQSNPSTELSSKANAIGIPNPTFQVGLDFYNNVNGGTVSNYQESVGGFPVSWGYWGDFSTSANPANPNNQNLDGLIWAVYTPSNPLTDIPSTGSFTYSNTQDITASSLGAVTGLNVQMDVNFGTNNITNGLIEAFTPNDKWVAVFDGVITAGDLDLNLNGASVIDSNPSTASPPRDVSGFIAGDFVGSNAEAIVGSFGLSEDANPANHIEGVFIAE